MIHTQTYSYSDLVRFRLTHAETHARPVRGRFVGMSEAVCLFSVPTSFPLGADLEDVSSEALIFTSLRGAADGYDTVPFGRFVGMAQA
eukprot:3498913-Pyramimonas_sp.AAC.1